MKNHSPINKHQPISNRTAGMLALFLSMALTACETPLFTKAGGEHLKAGDQIVLSNGDLNQASAAYKQALDSTYPEIKGQAAYNLAMIAREQGRNEAPYLEQSAAAGNMSAKLDLAEIYKRQNPPRLGDVERLSLELSATSATANITLLETARNDQDAARYATQAESILLDQVSMDDVEGKKSLMLARLYTLHGNLFNSPRDPEPHFRNAIRKGNVRAAQELAEYWGQPGAQQHSSEDIFALMVQAAEAGNDNAIKYVGGAYEEGRGVPRDINKAMSWNEKIQGHMKTDTLMRLAHTSMATDSKKAISLFSKAAAQGSDDAKLMLYGLKAEGVSENPKDYVGEKPDSIFGRVKKLDKIYGKTHPEMRERLYLLAANAGSGKAAIYMAERPGQDIATQNKWYEKAAKSGSGKAMLAIARHYKIGGEGQPSDEAKAFNWFEKAAKAGEAEGQYETGLAYARGTGVKKNKKEAKKWLEKAQGNGYVLAVEVLKTIDGNSSGEPKL